MPDVPEATAAFESDTWSGTNGCNSDGVEPDGLENSEPPSNGFLPVERDLSISNYLSSRSTNRSRGDLTIYTGFDSLLDWKFKNRPLSPNFNHTPDLLLDII